MAQLPIRLVAVLAFAGLVAGCETTGQSAAAGAAIGVGAAHVTGADPVVAGVAGAIAGASCHEANLC